MESGFLLIATNRFSFSTVVQVSRYCKGSASEQVQMQFGEHLMNCFKDFLLLKGILFTDSFIIVLHHPSPSKTCFKGSVLWVHEITYPLEGEYIQNSVERVSDFLFGLCYSQLHIQKMSRFGAETGIREDSCFRGYFHRYDSTLLRAGFLRFISSWKVVGSIPDNSMARQTLLYDCILCSWLRRTQPEDSSDTRTICDSGSSIDLSGGQYIRQEKISNNSTPRSSRYNDEEELSVYDKISFVYGKWWLPLHWFTALATRSRKEGRIKDSMLLNGLLRELLDYRNSCAIMFGYDWISVPLVYTQVVTIATYMYCIALIIGRQYLDPLKGYPKNDIDLYVPFFTLLQFFFYVGWLKVAEMILNPYGEDDDDFELNWCLDRSVHLTYLVVDNLQLKHPKVTKDFFWDKWNQFSPDETIG
ncbi:bestrophin-3 [Trichonephila clavata]|uniref:Bestrophin homolog n=1 Tax=Trichonephila clavata TaxID=2740835 RepID=A0A8X6J0Y8_TRICU|nr:bestrophin-3 [Trichonephila clavata]